MKIVFVESIFTEQFLNNNIMDNNQFKRSQDFSNIESNKANSPNQSMEEYDKKIFAKCAAATKKRPAMVS